MRIQTCLCSSLMAATAAVLSGCGWDGHFSLFGYTTKPNYDTSIRTVFVQPVGNITLATGTRRGVEFDLQKAVEREIEAKTPYKITSSLENADSELLLKIVGLNKALINANQIGEVREAQTIMTLELVWRDLRPGHLGELLSQPRQGGVRPPPGPIDPKAPPPPPVLITSIGNFIPELGGSISSAIKESVDRLAVQIISMMEIWPAARPAGVAPSPFVP